MTVFGIVLNPGILIALVGVVAVLLVFGGFIARLLFLVLGLALLSFIVLVAYDAYLGGDAYLQIIRNVSGALTSLAAAIAATILAGLRARSTQ